MKWRNRWVLHSKAKKTWTTADLKDISKMESDEKTEISAPKGPVTRSMAAGRGKIISNCVQVVTEMLQPLGELISKPWGWWHPMAADTD